MVLEKQETRLGEGPENASERWRALLYLFLAGVLLAAYFVIAARGNYFVLSDYFYRGNRQYLFSLPVEQLSSMLWKILLLLPATVFIAKFLSWWRRDRDIDLPVLNRTGFLVLLLAVLLVFVILISAVYQQTEITDDENAYAFQAKLLLKGKLFVDPPPSPCFYNTFLLRGDKFTGKYPLGHPLVLALGMLLGSRYIVTILSSLMLFLLAYRISFLLFKDKQQATLAVFLLAISPFYYLTSSTSLSHTTTALMLSVFMWLFLEIERKDRARTPLLWGLLAGLSAGYAFNVRPVTAVAFLVPFGALGLWRILKTKKLPSDYISIGVGFLVVLILTLFYNKIITGSYLVFPSVQYKGHETLGFGAMNPLPRAFVNVTLNAAKMNAFLFGFPMSLLFVGLMIFKRKKEFGEKLCYGIVALMAGAYFLYFSPGVSDTGPIYFYELIIPLVILTARGIVWLIDVTKALFPGLRTFVGYFVAVSAVLAILTFDVERILHVRHLTEKIREPYDVIAKANVHHALVFITSWPNQGFVYGFRNNSPDFSDDVLYCWSLSGEDNLKAVDRFPDRKTFAFSYDETAKNYRLRRISREELATLK